MQEEQRITNELEESRMGYTLAGTNPKLYQAIFDQKKKEEELGKVDWVVPESAEELEAILGTLQIEQQEEING